MVIREQGDRTAQREREVAAREMAADMGFQEQRAAARADLDAKLKARLEQHEEALAHQREDLEKQRSSLEKQRASLDDKGEDLRQLQGALERREQQLDREAQVRAADIIKQLEDELHVAQAESAANSEMVTRLTAELTETRARWAATGVEDPRQILTRLDEVKDENRDLRDKLAARLDDDTLDRLRGLEQQNRDLNEERERLRYELQELRGAQLADRISNLQVQQLSDAQEQFDVIKRGYETRIAELRGTLDQLVQDGRGDPSEPVFPNCVALDDDASLQEAGLLVDSESPDLHQLARDLQGTMWQGSKRAYDLDDVCGVLGGLAMSRLHLLEGPSGIGKTSLPVALAKALGAGCAIIEVQAGWRDRHDLFGHYNTFERRFQEEPFLLALYKAQTPRYHGRPFFIVLDEMNLARPEQYFSVLLSKLELDGQVGQDKTPIKLAPVPGGRNPRWMDESGTGISLPDNVWFVGTANQDESTLEFADKTYNRSYVLELPARRADATGWEPREKPEPYSVRVLRQAFDQAEADYGGKTAPVKALLADLVGDLDDVGRIHLDPRIEKQLNAYVPVVVSARGTDGGFDPVALAADQFIASKVLHQLHSRFEVTPEGIEKLQESINFYWQDRFCMGEPSRCRRVLANELRRRKALRDVPRTARYEPGPLVTASVIHVARQLECTGSVREYLDTPVLVPDIADQAASTELEEAIERHLPALTAICGRPHDRLTVEHVLMRAAQARRVPVAGLARLASRSEDWAGVRFGEIVPGKLLAQRYDEDYDFYENQVAVQLVDGLRRYIAQRVDKLEKLERHLADLKRYQEALEDGRLSHWTQRRLANLLAEAAHESERQSVPVADALGWLTRLRVRVNLLRGSPLYSKANRRVAIPSRLRRTNLLTRDRRYHDTARLWEAWALRESRESDILREHRREFPAAYTAYVTAIVLRACQILGLTPIDPSQPMTGGAPVELGTTDGIRLRLLAACEGIVELSAVDVPVVRVVALPNDLTVGGSATETDESVTALFRRLGGTSVPTIVAHPSDASARDAMPDDLVRRMHWTGRFPSGTGVPEALRGVIPVTPLEIESTERMARALRWAWYATWMETAYQPGTDTASAVVGQLRTCPLCRRSTTVTFEARDDTFACRCECGGNWGTRICGTCHEKFPVFFWARKSTDRKSGEDEGEGKDPYVTGDKVDAIFGSEVLALPCPSFTDWTKFRCPQCNVCQGAPSCGCGAYGISRTL